MEDAYFVIQDDSSYRSCSFGNLGSQRFEQGFKVAPCDVGAHGILKDRVERLGLFLVQGSTFRVSKTPRSFQQPPPHTDDFVWLTDDIAPRYHRSITHPPVDPSL